MAPKDPSRSAARLATVVAVPVALLVGVLIFWLMGGFGAGGGTGAGPSPTPSNPRPQSTAPVEMAAPALSERAAVVCRALLSQLPDQVRDLNRRPVTAGAEQNAAYGDPAITVACGGPPATVPLDAELWGMDRVCWYAQEGPERSVWTAIDREVPVTVTVPKEYEGPGQWTNAFSTTLVATVPSTAEVPSGCR